MLFSHRPIGSPGAGITAGVKVGMSGGLGGFDEGTPIAGGVLVAGLEYTGNATRLFIILDFGGGLSGL